MEIVEKNNKKLIVILVVLVLLVLLLASYIIYDGIVLDGKEQVIYNDDIEEIDYDDNSKLQISLSMLIGKYVRGEFIVDEVINCNENNVLNGTDYYSLELKKDGTYTYHYGTNCGTGYYANGKYLIDVDKITLYNDNCVNSVNCTSVYELDYGLVDNNVRIKHGTVELKKK